MTGIIHYEHPRVGTGSGLARIIDNTPGWPLVEFPDGTQTCLNNRIVEIRPATPEECEQYERERASA